MLDIRKACSAGIVSAAADRRSPHQEQAGASPSFMPAAVPAPAARGPAAVCAWDWFGELAGEVRHGLSYCNVTST